MQADVHFLRTNETLSLSSQPPAPAPPCFDLLPDTFARGFTSSSPPPSPSLSIRCGAARSVGGSVDLMFHIYTLICILRAGCALEVTASSCSRTPRRLECAGLDCDGGIPGSKPVYRGLYFFLRCDSDSSDHASMGTQTCMRVAPQVCESGKAERKEAS